MRTFFRSLAAGLGVCLATLGLLSCGGDTVATPDLAASVSCCGKPGDVGNSKGVGKYCTDSSGVECRGNSAATVCSVIGDTAARKTTFCTTTCDPNVAGYCGENASCTMDTATKVFGCTPNSCTTNLPPGCSA